MNTEPKTQPSAAEARFTEAALSLASAHSFLTGRMKCAALNRYAERPTVPLRRAGAANNQGQSNSVKLRQGQSNSDKVSQTHFPNSATETAADYAFVSPILSILSVLFLLNPVFAKKCEEFGKARRAAGRGLRRYCSGSDFL